MYKPKIEPPQISRYTTQRPLPIMTLEWNAETVQWELNGEPFKGEIKWCNGEHDGINIHDPWWCCWYTLRLLERERSK